jgi:hypothetical protein
MESELSGMIEQLQSVEDELEIEEEKSEEVMTEEV